MISPRDLADPAAAAALRIAEECIGMRVRRLSRTVTRIFDEALRPHGISTAQLNMLVAITRAGPLRPFELGRALDLEKSTVTRNLDRMVSHRWIRATREPDGNGYRLEVEPAGRALLARAFPSWSAAQKRARRHVGEALASAVRELESGGP
ncbi:MAG TPA: MarR family transcriptional regulator [Anaeromyxobacteraceae bacterium]